MTTTTKMTTTARTIITHTTTFTTIIHARHPHQNDNRKQISSNVFQDKAILGLHR